MAWGVTEELLAQLIEEVSVFVADRRRREPRTLPRPYKQGGSGRRASGKRAMIAAAMARGQVRRG